MRVLERRPGGLAVVLEQEDVAQAMVAFQVDDAIAKGPEQIFDALFRQRTERILCSGVSIITS